MQGIRHLLLTALLACGLIIIVIVPRSAQAAPPRSLALSPAVSTVITSARALLGAPYAYIGDDPRTGFSCIGFIHYLFGRIGVDVPYNLDLAYAAGPRVRGALQPGDLVFFSNTVWKGLSHVALYTGDDQVIGADNFSTGVEMTRLSSPYWSAHYTGATRPLSGIAAPLPSIIAVPPPAPVLTVRVRTGQFLRGGAGGDLYSGPGFGYQRIDRLAPRIGLRVVRIVAPWADVVYRGASGDYYGWVNATYLAGCNIMIVPIAAPHRARSTPPDVVAVVAVTVPVLFLRQGPSLNAPIVRRLLRGERLVLLGHLGAWDRVRAGPAIGWAYAAWLAAGARG